MNVSEATYLRLLEWMGDVFTMGDTVGAQFAWDCATEEIRINSEYADNSDRWFYTQLAR